MILLDILGLIVCLPVILFLALVLIIIQIYYFAYLIIEGLKAWVKSLKKKHWKNINDN